MDSSVIVLFIIFLSQFHFWYFQFSVATNLMKIRMHNVKYRFENSLLDRMED